MKGVIMSFVIFTDSASNLTKDLLDQYDLHMLSYYSTIDGQDYLCYDENRDYEEAGRKFYDDMRNGSDIRTSLINSSMFLDAFEPFLKEGKDLMFIGISSGLSGTVQAASIAADELSDTYPERKVIIIDSMGASLGEGLMVIKMAEMRTMGCTIEEAASYYEYNKMKMNHIFTVGDLQYLKRGGRISAAEAAIGNLLSIKPILKADDNGKIIVHDKVRSRRRALDALITLLCNRIINPSSQVIGIVHCDAPLEAEYVATEIKKALPVKDIIVRYYDLCTGAHVGPGTIALFFMGENRMGCAKSEAI